jgi:putative spermidine/putrescine transport system substrate-binding protein
MTRTLLAAAAAAAALALGACGDDDEGGAGEPAAGAGAATAAFDDVRQEARGQRVRWWMFGGDDRINAYVDDHVVPAARKAGVRLERVPITDTADAVQRVVSERRAGKDTGGSVDLIWINGENFAAGKKAGLWLEDWATDLPSYRYVDPQDPTITTDFKVPVDGQEAPWSRAAFVFAYDSAKVDAPPRTFEELLAYAKENPGRFTYPAPPDFTGSAFVRQVVAALGEDEAFAYLEELKPFMHREGRAFPEDVAELNRLYADGQVDFAMSYEYGFIRNEVRDGDFPDSTRPFLLGEGALSNVSFVTIPANSGSQAGAKVVADLLLSPELQAVKADPDELGSPTVLDPARVPAAQREGLAASARGPYVLEDLGTPVEEFAADDVAPLEQRWRREVLR